MTDAPNQAKYQDLAHSCEIVESRLLDDLVEILNGSLIILLCDVACLPACQATSCVCFTAEVCNKVIESVEGASNWVKGTFLFTRIKKNSQLYGLASPTGTQVTNEIAAAFLSDHLRVALAELTSACLIEIDDQTQSVSALKPAQIMSRNMLRLSTMKSILALPLDASIDEVLKMLCTTAEVNHDVRHGQKKVLKDLIIAGVRFTIPRSKKLDNFDKTYLLLQGLLGHLPMEDQSMFREQNSMVEKAGSCSDHFIHQMPPMV